MQNKPNYNAQQRWAQKYYYVIDFSKCAHIHLCGCIEMAYYKASLHFSDQQTSDHLPSNTVLLTHCSPLLSEWLNNCMWSSHVMIQCRNALWLLFNIPFLICPPYVKSKLSIKCGLQNKWPVGWPSLTLGKRIWNYYCSFTALLVLLCRTGKKGERQLQPETSHTAMFHG